MPCCGKRVCIECMNLSAEEMASGNMKKWCLLCRVPLHKSTIEFFERVKKRMKQNDPEAYYELGDAYNRGRWHLPQDDRKAFELFKQSSELGSCRAQYESGYAYYYGEGVEKNVKKAIHHWKLAAIGGHEQARYNLGAIEGNNGNVERSVKHYIIAARAGHEYSLAGVKEGFMKGDVAKEEYADTLRAYQKAQDDMKSDMRDEFAKLLSEHPLH